MPHQPNQQRERVRREQFPAVVHAWRWRIAAASAPIPLGWALAVGDAVMDALQRNAWTIGGTARLPVCLHGPDDPQEQGWNHAHAFVLPEDADGDGCIDHVTVSATAGLDPRAIRLLAATDRLTLGNGDWVMLIAERMCASGGLPASSAGPARVWVSSTLYLPPNGRPRYDARDASRQLRGEIRHRRLAAALVEAPEPLPIEPDDPALAPLVLERDNGKRPPVGSEPGRWRLTFGAPVTGPLAFGWECHRGLGVFAPAPAALGESGHS